MLYKKWQADISFKQLNSDQFTHPNCSHPRLGSSPTLTVHLVGWVHAVGWSHSHVRRCVCLEPLSTGHRPPLPVLKCSRFACVTLMVPSCPAILSSVWVHSPQKLKNWWRKWHKRKNWHFKGIPKDNSLTSLSTNHTYREAISSFCKSDTCSLHDISWTNRHMFTARHFMNQPF